MPLWGGTCSRCGKHMAAGEPQSFQVEGNRITRRLCDQCTKDRDRLKAMEKAVAEFAKPLDRFLAHFEITQIQLPHLGLFLLGHTLLDRWLIVLLALRECEAALKSEAITAPEFDTRLDILISEYSKGPFGRHIGLVEDRALLSPALIEICKEVNRGRIDFLHWMPERFSVPKYKGLDVTTPEGLDRALEDIWTVIEKISVRSRGVDF
jgi:hypothetical protein